MTPPPQDDARAKPTKIEMHFRSDLELPDNCGMIEERGRYRVYFGKKQVMVGEGHSEFEAIMDAYRGLVKYWLRPPPGGGFS